MFEKLKVGDFIYIDKEPWCWDGPAPGLPMEITRETKNFWFTDEATERKEKWSKKNHKLQLFDVTAEINRENFLASNKVKRLVFELNNSNMSKTRSNAVFILAKLEEVAEMIKRETKKK